MNKISANYIIKWIIFSGIASVTGLSITYFFIYLLDKIYFFTTQTNSYFILLPLLAPFLCKYLAYHFSPESSEEGVLSYLNSVNEKFGNLPFKVTFFKFIAALVTLGTNLSGGIVAPLVRVNSGIASFLGNQRFIKKLKIDDEDKRTFVICGASAIVASVFHAPLSSGLFAVEILKRANMKYLDLFPSILAACFTTAVAKGLDLTSIFPFKSTVETFPLKNLIWIILIGFFSGYFSILYVNFYHWVSTVSERKQLNFGSKIAGSIVVIIIAYFFGEGLLGTSIKIFESLVNGELPVLPEYVKGRYFIFIALIVLAGLKGITNCLTVGTGYSAGFAGPSVIMGLMIGAAFGHLLNIPPSSGSYYSFMAAGMSGVLSASMNVPLSAAVMGAEIFGSNIGFSSTISSIIAFQVARGTTLYKSQIK